MFSFVVIFIYKLAEGKRKSKENKKLWKRISKPTKKPKDNCGFYITGIQDTSGKCFYCGESKEMHV